jgi:adenylate cyclase
MVAVMPTGQLRRLAAIVGLDIAGYSALTERDQQAAIAAVAALNEAVTAAATHFGGRIFNRAGDGMMLEFPSVQPAVRFALEVLRRLRDGPPVRVGVHLGEVAVAPDGDVLGHGVNVAARLCALAEPRGLLVTEQVYAPLPKRLQRLLLPQGPVTFQKMSETLPVYGLRGAVGLLGRLRLSARRPWRVGIAAAVAAAGLGALWLSRPQEQGPPMVAVLPFAGGGSDDVAAGVADEIIMSLARSQDLRVAARSSSFAFQSGSGAEAGRRLRAQFVLDGDVRVADGRLRVNAWLEDVRAGETVWANAFERDLREAFLLQSEIAANVATAVRGRTARAAPAPTEAGVDPAAVEDYFAGRALRLQRTTTGLRAAIERLERATQTAPQFARAWAELAGARLILSDRLAQGQTPDPMAIADLRAAALDAAEQALRLDPQNAYALAVRAGLEPPTAWAARRSWLDRAVAAAPGDPIVLRARASLLSDLGYWRAARADLETARMIDPLDPQLLLAWTLEADGQGRAARSLLSNARDATDPAVWNTRLLFAMFDGDAAGAGALLAAHPQDVSDAAIARFEATRRALSAQAARAEATALWRTAAADDPALTDDAVMMLGLIGAPEAAFALAEAAPAGALFTADLAHAPALADLLRDPRYLRLMARGGLVAYWRDHNAWPDFCTAPNAAYDCAALAASFPDADVR